MLSTERIWLSSLITSSIKCSNEVCNPQRSLTCSQGIKLKCKVKDVKSDIPYLECLEGFFSYGSSKCIGVPDKAIVDYSTAKEICSKYNTELASLSLVDDKRLYQILKNIIVKNKGNVNISIYRFV